MYVHLHVETTNKKYQLELHMIFPDFMYTQSSTLYNIFTRWLFYIYIKSIKINDLLNIKYHPITLN